MVKYYRKNCNHTEGSHQHQKGETRTLDLTFPEDYTQDLAGKAVEFTVTVNAVKEPLTEPTDQWVAEDHSACLKAFRFLPDQTHDESTYYCHVS